MNQIVLFGSCSDNSNYQLGRQEVHPGNNFAKIHISEEVKTIGIKEVDTGRSHTVIRTNDDKLFAFGRNDYGQCSTGTSQDLNIMTPCLFKPDVAASGICTYSCGWFHTAIIFENRKKFMVSGFLYSHNSLYFAEVPEMSLKTGESGFTHCDSHCHGVVAVIDGHIILDRENGVTRYDTLSLVEEKVLKICGTSDGFLFLTPSGTVYGNKSNFSSCSPSGILFKFNYGGIVRELRSIGLATLSVMMKIEKKNETVWIDHRETILSQNADEEWYPLYSARMQYNKRERKLSEFTNLDAVNNFLSHNPQYVVLNVCAGCDFNMVVLGTCLSKSDQRMKKQLLEYRFHQQLTDVSFSIQ